MKPGRSLPGIGSHQSARRVTDDWLTPPHIIDALGPFDLDPCCPADMPWPTARMMLTEEHDGLTHPWGGLVWLNPPYSSVAPWLQRLAEHGDGIALVFARTETEAWQRWVWPYAIAVMFIAGRLTFHNGDGTLGRYNGGAPSALIAYGSEAARRLHAADLTGKLAGHLVAPV